MRYWCALAGASANRKWLTLALKADAALNDLSLPSDAHEDGGDAAPGSSFRLSTLRTSTRTLSSRSSVKGLNMKPRRELKSKYSLDSFSNRVIETSSMAIEVDQINENVNLSDEENELVERLKRRSYMGSRCAAPFSEWRNFKWSSQKECGTVTSVVTASPMVDAVDDYELRGTSRTDASNAISMEWS